MLLGELVLDVAGARLANVDVEVFGQHEDAELGAVATLAHRQWLCDAEVALRCGCREELMSFGLLKRYWRRYWDDSGTRQLNVS